MSRLILIVLLLAVLTACSTPHFVPIPLRDADLYPESQTKEGIAVAVDQITYPQRVKQYFGADLTKQEVVPINIIVSNHGKARFMIKPSDVLLMIGKHVIDAVPAATVEQSVSNEYGQMSEETAKKVEDYFSKLMLQETVVAPRENYQAIMFLKIERPKGEWGANDGKPFDLQKVFQEGTLKVRVAVTDVDTSARVLFGPFSLSGL